MSRNLDQVKVYCDEMLDGALSESSLHRKVSALGYTVTCLYRGTTQFHNLVGFKIRKKAKTYRIIPTGVPLSAFEEVGCEIITVNR